nr:MAG TPA: dsDNA helicase [Caudoviricetes sp.]
MGTIEYSVSHVMSKNKITLIGEELKRCEKAIDAKYKSSHTILDNLLGQIQKVNFLDKSGLPEDAKIPRKLYVVITIDELLDVAVANNWGLATRDGFIYVFNGEYWHPICAEDFKPFLALAARKMGVPVLESKYHLFKDELYKQFLSESTLRPPEGGEYVLINLKNGTFEISPDRQGLRPFRREDFIKYQLSFRYDRNAICPIFDKYLERVLPDEGCRNVLCEYIGYIFVSNLKLEKAAILYGSGANGKSVFFEIINALLGQENICSYSLQNLTKYDSYQRAELANRLLNYASEINGKLEASIFKQLVSGEPVEARQIYGKPFTMKSYAKLMFNCNELPKEVEQTNAFFRRFIIIPFSETIPEPEQDPELARKIIDNELSGVFNWVLGGLTRLLSQKHFTFSEKVKEQVDNYRKESDSVVMFIDEFGYTPSFEGSFFLKMVYNEYKEYTIDGGYRPVSIKTFAERLRMMRFEVVKQKTGRIFYAVKK